MSSPIISADHIKSIYLPTMKSGRGCRKREGPRQFRIVQAGSGMDRKKRSESLPHTSMNYEVPFCPRRVIGAFFGLVFLTVHSSISLYCKV